MNVNGIGKINGERVDCSNPSIFSMKLDSDGKQLNRTDLASGSCAISTFVPDTRWDYTQEGLKKTKRWSVTGEVCVVGPCKGIVYATHIFYYKRVN